MTDYPHTMYDIAIDDGKYRIIFTQDIENNSCEFFALRHGEKWRDLTGDGMVLALVQEIDRLRCGLERIANWDLSCTDRDSKKKMRKWAHKTLDYSKEKWNYDLRGNKPIESG